MYGGAHARALARPRVDLEKVAGLADVGQAHAGPEAQGARLRGRGGPALAHGLLDVRDARPLVHDFQADAPADDGKGYGHHGRASAWAGPRQRSSAARVSSSSPPATSSPAPQAQAASSSPGPGSGCRTRQMPGTSISSAMRNRWGLARRVTSSVSGPALSSRSLMRSPAITVGARPRWKGLLLYGKRFREELSRRGSPLRPTACAADGAAAGRRGLACRARRALGRAPRPRIRAPGSHG